jgi:hypothetical protein
MTNDKQQTEINAVEYLGKVNQFAKENNTDRPRQQTAIEWLIEHIRQDVFVHSKSTKEWNQVFQQAKEMEKERIIDAHYEGQCNQTEGYPLQIAEQYYNETYGGGEQ